MFRELIALRADLRESGVISVHEPLFMVGTLVVAMAYSAVGHGGASGYLALMAFTAMATTDASTLALAINVAVSSISFFLFRRAKHFNWKLAWPFLLGSVPLAFVGGSLHVPDSAHKWVLAMVLLYAAIVLIVQSSKPSNRAEPRLGLQVLIGAGIGLVSGIVGVGGGIFLSPVIMFCGWANARQTAAVSSLFILLNSIAGFAARSNTAGRIVSEHSAVLMVAVMGALVGSWVGANRIPDAGVRRLLGVVLLFAVFKLAAR